MQKTNCLAQSLNSPSHNSKFIKIHLKTNQISKAAPNWKKCNGTLLLSIKNDRNARKIAYGDRLFCKGKINAIYPPLNPHAFDYRKYLHLKNIDYQSFIGENDWMKIDSAYGNPVLNLAFNLRSSFLKILKTHLTGKNEFAVGSSPDSRVQRRIK